MENRAFKVAGIRNLIKRNYDIAVDLIDVEALIDDTLSMADNWDNLKGKVLVLYPKEHKCLFT